MHLVSQKINLYGEKTRFFICFSAEFSKKGGVKHQNHYYRHKNRLICTTND